MTIELETPEDDIPPLNDSPEKTNLKIHFLMNYLMKWISHQSISKPNQLMMENLVMKIQLMITTKLSQLSLLVLIILNGIKIFN